MQFGLSVLVLDFRTGQITGLSVDIVDTIKMFALAQSQIIEKPVRFEGVSVPGDIEVLAYPEVVVDTAGIKIP